MRYKIIVLIILSMASSQSLYNRFLGADSFSGSARSTAMGNTHLLNSTGSHNVRFNSAMLSNKNNSFDFQVNRFSSFERWSMPMRDSFDEVLVYGDYVSNEFSNFLVSGGATMSLKIPFIGNLGVGFSHYPLTHFTYQYSEEVRGTYRPEDDEYASKDPIVGYQNLNVNGVIYTSSIGAGATLNLFGDFKTSVGGSINLTQPFTLDERVEIDILYTDVTNLAVYPEIDNSYDIESDLFVSASAQVDLTASSVVGLFYESELQLNTDNNYVHINPTDGLFQYWNFGEIFTDELDGGEEPCSGPYQTDSCGDTWEDFDGDGVFDDNEVFTPEIHDLVGNGVWDEDEDFIDSNENDQWDYEDVYLPSGLNYLKPQLIGFSWGYTSTTTQSLSFSFEVDQYSYNNHLNLDDFYKWKFGFEYLTQLGTPVRGGLVFSTSPLNSVPSSTMFTFGSGKTIGKILVDISGTYQLYIYKYPDLFVVEDDVRPDYYDTVRDSQLNLSLSVSYSF